MNYFNKIKSISAILLSVISFSCSSGYDIEFERNTNKIGDALTNECVLLDTLFVKKL